MLEDELVTVDSDVMDVVGTAESEVMRELVLAIDCVWLAVRSLRGRPATSYRR